MALESERRRVAHLLRRAGFGAPPDEVERCAAQGVEATVDELVNFERVPDTMDATLKQLDGGLIDLNTLEDVQTWWLYRMLQTKRPLQEKMTLFWHDHFATANAKVNSPLLMHQQNALFRAHALRQLPRRWRWRCPRPGDADLARRQHQSESRPERELWARAAGVVHARDRQLYRARCRGGRPRLHRLEPDAAPVGAAGVPVQPPSARHRRKDDPRPDRPLERRRRAADHRRPAGARRLPDD